VQYNSATTYYMNRIFILIAFLFFLLNYSKAQESGAFIDSRDGRTYKWVNISGQVWMAENLAYLPKVEHPSKGTLESGKNNMHYYVYGYTGESITEAKQSLNYQTYGVLYNWTAAKEVCLTGWHLPSDEEFMLLEKNLGMPEKELKERYYRMGGNLGEKLKSKIGWLENGNGKDIFNFNALPGGFRHSGDPNDSKNNGAFSYLEWNAFFWTSTLYKSEKGGIAYRRDLISNSKGMCRFPSMIESGYSVRCIKD